MRNRLKRGDNAANWIYCAATALALSAGLYLRVWNLDAQIIEDDEWHAVRAAVQADTLYLATHNHLPDLLSDYSIPLALWNRLLVSSIGIDEVTMRLPVLLAGVAMLVLLTRFGWRMLDPLAATIVAWLFATSPILLLYSRFARPYAFVALFGAGTWISYWRSSQTKQLGWTLGCAGCGALAVYFSIVALPAVVCVWACVLLEASVEHRRARARNGACHVSHLARGATIAAGGAIMLILLLPSWRSQAEFIARTSHALTSVSPASWWDVSGTLLGVRDNLACALLLSTALIGAVVGYRQTPGLVRVALGMIVAQVMVLSATSPPTSNFPLVLARYCIVALPGLLFLVGIGIAQLARLAGRIAGRRSRLVACASAAALIATVILEGPIREIYFRPNAYTNHIFYYATPGWNVSPDLVPTFYTTFATLGGRKTILEVPWTLEWGLTIYGEYQSIHRLAVRSITTQASLNARGVRFARLVPVVRFAQPDLAGIDFVVVHKDIVAEVFEVSRRELPSGDTALDVRRRALAREADGFLRVFGGRKPPLSVVYEDERIRVFATRSDA